jgi:hypothetical protein
MANTFIQTFEDIYTAAMNRVKIPVSNTTELAKIKTIINEEYQTLAAKPQIDWWWLYLYQRAIQVPATYETGTITVSPGDTAFVGASTAWTTTNNVGTANLVAGDFIRIAGDDEVYEIKTVTDATNCTLGNADATIRYLEAAKSAASYEAFRYLFNLPTNFSDMVKVYKAGGRPFSPLPEGIKNLRHIMMAGGNGFPISVSARGDGTTAYYAVTGTEAQKQLLIWPPSDEDLTIYYDYKVRITNLSATTDEPLLPLEYRPILVAAAVKEYAAKFLRNTDLRNEAESKRVEIFRDMLADAKQKPYADTPQFRVDISQYRRPRRRYARSFDPDYAKRG